MGMKIIENDEISRKFRALSKLSKGAGRLPRTFAFPEAPPLHPQAFRSTRSASAPQKTAYKKKAPMFCMIHENWGFFNKNGYFGSFFDTSQSFKRRQRLLFGSHTSKDVEERRQGHTNAKKSKRVMLAPVVEKGAAHIDA